MVQYYYSYAHYSASPLITSGEKRSTSVLHAHVHAYFTYIPIIIIIIDQQKPVYYIQPFLTQWCKRLIKQHR